MKNTGLIKILCIVITIFIVSCGTNNEVKTPIESLQIGDNSLTSEDTQVKNSVPQTADIGSTVTIDSKVQFKH